MKIFTTKVRFLGYEIYQGTIVPIKRAIEFADKFPNEITDKKQLQRFLGCLNYVAEFLSGIRVTCEPLYKRLRKNPPPWTKEMTSIIIKIKNAVKEIPCISILDPSAKLIVETDASELGYGGILKQIPPNSSKEQIVKYHSGIWNQAQKNYLTVKKEILAIVLCVSKFQEDLFNKTFLIRTDCKAAPNVLENDVKNLVLKQIFSRWQVILSCFDFTIEHIKGELNSLPDFLTREFLQGKNGAKSSLQ